MPVRFWFRVAAGEQEFGELLSEVVDLSHLEARHVEPFQVAVTYLGGFEDADSQCCMQPSRLEEHPCWDADPSCGNVPKCSDAAEGRRVRAHGSLLAQVIFGRPTVNAANRVGAVSEFERSALAAVEVVPAVDRLSMTEHRQAVHEGSAARRTEEVRG